MSEKLQEEVERDFKCHDCYFAPTTSMSKIAAVSLLLVWTKQQMEVESIYFKCHFEGWLLQCIRKGSRIIFGEKYGLHTI